VSAAWAGRLAPPRRCADCGQVRPHAGRGLCEPCRARHHRAGTLSLWPLSGRAAHRRNPPRSAGAVAGRAEDLAWLVETGETVEMAAQRVGVSGRTAARYQARLRRQREAA